MALISCPECGREKVSDTTTSCPGCGYNIAEHFKRLEEQQQQQKKIKQEEEKKKKEIEDLMQKGVLGEETIKELQKGWDMSLAIEVDKKISEMPIPPDPDAPENAANDIRSKHSAYIRGALLILGDIAGLIALIVNSGWDDAGTVFMIMVFIIWPVFGWGIWIICKPSLDKEKRRAEYNRYKSMGEYAYKKKIYGEKLLRKYSNPSYYSQQPSIVCPMCHMPSGEKISATRRVVSTTALGLASSDIGKQYRCKNCGHKW